MTVKVLEAESSRPIRGAVIRITRDQEVPAVLSEADASGSAVIALPVSTSPFELAVHAPGRIQQRLRAPALQRRPGGILEVRLSKATTSIGGVVVDPEGRPVSGAVVVFQCSLYRPRKPVCGATETAVKLEAVSDADGRWRIDNLDGPPRSPFFWVRHPQFAYFGRNEDGHVPYPPLDDLLEGKAKFVLDRGVPLEGTVVDAAGKPVEGAVLIRDMIPQDDSQSCTTDREGRFRFPAVGLGCIRIGVKAKGRGGALVVIPELTAKKTIEVRLDSGRRITGRIVDESGRGVAQASCEAWIDWLGPYRLTAHSDDDGRFVIDDAPRRALTLSPSCAGSQSLANVVVTPGQDSVVLKLKRSTKLMGSVVDAATGRPIERFGAMVEYSEGAKEYRLEPDLTDNAIDGEGGRFEFDAAENLPLRAAAWADGYRKATSKKTTPKGAEWKVELRLERETSVGVSGTVQTPEGRPAVGAKVFLETRGHSGFQIDDYSPNEVFSRTCTFTDDAGRFQFVPQEEPVSVAVRHRSGFGSVPLAPPGAAPTPVRVKLAPWARIRGTFHLDGKPAAGKRIGCYGMALNEQGQASPASVYALATTDSSGRFDLQHVPHSTGWLGTVKERHLYHIEFETSLGTFQTKPGELIELNHLRPFGRSVVGRLDVPPATAERLLSWRRFDRVFGPILARSDRPPIPWPPELMNKDKNTRDRWLKEWNDSPAGREYRSKLREAVVQFGEGGRIRLDGLRPDKYRLKFSLYADGRLDALDRLGDCDFEFEVPAKDAESQKPIDVGLIPVWMSRQPHVGDLMPNVALTQVDGASWRISKARGRVLVLVWWTSRRPLSDDEVNDLKSLQTAFGDAAEVVLINYSQNRSSLADSLKKRPLPGRQTCDDGWFPASQRLEIDDSPTIMVVDPDGTVAWKSDSTRSLAEEVQRARK